MGLLDKLKTKIKFSKEDWNDHLTNPQRLSMQSELDGILKEAKAAEDKLKQEYTGKPKDLDKAIEKATAPFDKEIEELAKKWKKVAKENFVREEKARKGGAQDAQAHLTEAGKHCQDAIKLAQEGLAELKKVDCSGLLEPVKGRTETAIGQMGQTVVQQAAKSAMEGFAKLKAAHQAAAQ